MCSLSEIKALVLRTRAEYDESVLVFLQTIPSAELIDDIKSEFIKTASNTDELFYGPSSQAIIYVERAIQIPNLFKTSPWLTLPLDDIKARLETAFPKSKVLLQIKDYGIAWIHITVSMDLTQ
jgi:hypothetical protein